MKSRDAVSAKCLHQPRITSLPTKIIINEGDTVNITGKIVNFHRKLDGKLAENLVWQRKWDKQQISLNDAIIVNEPRYLAVFDHTTEEYTLNIKVAYFSVIFVFFNFYYVLHETNANPYLCHNSLR